MLRGFWQTDTDAAGWGSEQTRKGVARLQLVADTRPCRDRTTVVRISVLKVGAVKNANTLADDNPPIPFSRSLFCFLSFLGSSGSSGSTG